ncbi:MAG: hypothetical protein KDC43_02575 [Saprospiraceae bacterium]|nr:hypothetical protein [Saprospiraceae bacterium]
MKKGLIATTLLGLGLFVGCTTAPILFDGSGPNPPNPPNPPGLDNPCPDGVVSFQAEVLPLLVSNCALSGCHDANSHKEGVVLDSYDHVMKHIKANNPNGSKLYKSITDSGGDDAMPPYPYPRLTNEEIDLIRTWINQGAENTDCTPACDPENASFAANIFPVINTYCVGCHNDNLSEAGINLKDYQHIRAVALSGQLLGTIRYESGYQPMPPSGGQLNDCYVTQIQKWIDEGAQDN